MVYGLVHGPCMCLCWISWGSSTPSSLDCGDLSESTAQPCRLSTTPLSFVSANLVRVYSSSLSRSLLNKLSKIRPSTDPWGTLLTTGLQQVCHWSQPSELCQSGSSQAYHTAHSSSPHFLQGKCWKPCWSHHRQHIPLFPYLPALSFHPGRLSHWFSMIPHGESMLTTPDF